MIRSLILLFITVLIFFAAQGQEYSYVHYDTRDGLAGSVVYCAVQDQDGFLWFGTETGLSRFDGTGFKNFTVADGLPDNEVINLYVDSKNRVWILPFKNSICFYWHGKIHNANNDTLVRNLTAVMKNESYFMMENSRKELAIEETKQIIIIDAAGKVKIIDKFRGQEFNAFRVGLNNNNDFRVAVTPFWVDSTSSRVVDPAIYLGLLFGDVEGDSIRMSRQLTGDMPNGHNSLYISPELEISRRFDSLYFFLPGTSAKFALPIPEGFTNLNRVSDSVIAITSAINVTMLNFYTRQVQNVFLPGKLINNVILDSEGSLWFLSGGEGTFRLVSSDFKSFYFRINNNPLPVLMLKKIQNNLYIGTDHFLLWKMDMLAQRLTHQKLLTNISAMKTRTINVLADDELLIGTDIGFATTLGRQFSHKIDNLSIKSICLSGDTIFAATAHIGLTLNKKSFLPIDTFWLGRTTAVYRRGGDLYIGTLNGLYLKNNDNTRFLGEIDSALASRISVIEGGADGVIWVATYGSGIAGYKDGKLVASIKQANGLTSNFCRAIFLTGSTMWVGTDRGLNKIIRTGGKYTITRYSTADGLLSDIVNTVFVDKNMVYVGTPAGMTSFDEGKVFTNSKCVLRLTGVRSRTRQWFYDTTVLSFGHFENDLRFDFSGISFKSGNDITYRHRLLGLEESWQTGRENFLSYPALPSGDYELQVIAINKFGVQSNMISTRFTIAKLLYEKNWFRLLVIISLGAAIWILVNQRIKRIRWQEKDKTETNRKIAELEQKALKAQMNPHFIFNCLNSIQQYVMDKDVEGANKFITDFARLIRLTLDISSKPRISVYEEINYISTYLELEKTRFESKFNYRIYVTEGVSTITHFIPPMILQPYIENSIRHGVRYRNDKNGFIEINFRIDQTYLVCTITDNGVGRTASKRLRGTTNIEYQSKGMSLTAKRIEMLNKNYIVPIFIEVEDIITESNICEGTKVTIQFPLKDTLHSS